MRILIFTVLLAASALFASDQADRTVGSPNAPVTLEIWSDFQCPHCAQLHFGALKQAMSDCVPAGKVRIVFRDFILSQMPYSRKAAQYADAAAQIGRYERVCDTLFRTQQEWGRTGDVDAAVAKDFSPAEMGKIHKILADPKSLAEINSEIDADMALARKIPLESTPTMIISGRGKRYPITDGNVRYDLLSQLINTILK